MKFWAVLFSKSKTSSEKTLKLGLLGLVLFLTLAGGLLKYLKEKGAPQYKGEVSLSGLGQDVEVLFDKKGIPHIKAIHEQDAFRALGYVMAQDRLFQMDLLRRLAKGRLSEIFGEKALEADKLFRTLDLLAPFKESTYKADPETLEVMQAFYQGVNQFISQESWPFEYTLLGVKPEPFEVMDGFGVLGYMAYSFAMGIKTDPLMEALSQRIDPRNLNELRREPLDEKKERTVQAPGKRPYFLNGIEDFNDSSWKNAQTFLEDHIGLFSGSNAWALSPKRSEDGHAILASDPHVSFAVPGLWYEAHVKWEKGLKKSNREFYGHFVPLLPFPAMAHTPHHAWAVTISYLDDMDFIWQQVKDNRVLVENAWQALEVKEEVIKVKGAGEVKFQVQKTPVGPLMMGLLSKFSIKKRDGLDAALKWGHHERDNRPAQAFYGALLADNQREFEEALSKGRSPGVNVIYADNNGNIARYLFGTQYLRKRNDSGDFFKALKDDELKSHYQVVPFEERLHLVNPDNGVVVSANQKPENSPQLKSGYFQPFDRYETIHSIIEAKDKWSLEDFQMIQTLPVNILFPNYVMALKDVLKDQKLTEREEQVWKRFSEWQGRSPKGSAESLIFYTFFNRLQRLLVPELKEDEFNLYCETNYIWHHTARELLRGEKKAPILKAFKETVATLYKKHGPMVNWSLGSEQTLTLSHPLSRAGAHLAFFLDIGPTPIDGGFNQINNMRPVGCKDGLTVKAGPSTRRLVSFKDPRESWGILPLGNSGHYASPFFSDQWGLFKKNEYRRQIMRPLKKEEIYSQLLFKKN